MALQRGARVGGGDWLDLLELCRDGPVSCVFRIVSHEPDERGDFGPILPVVVDVMVCSGPREGEVHLGERIIGAPTAALRGVRNPKKGDPIEPPVTAVDAELMFRVEQSEAFGRAFAALNVPSDAECDQMAKVHDDGRGWGAVPARTAESAVARGRPW